MQLAAHRNVNTATESVSWHSILHKKESSIRAIKWVTKWEFLLEVISLTKKKRRFLHCSLVTLLIQTQKSVLMITISCGKIFSQHNLKIGKSVFKRIHQLKLKEKESSIDFGEWLVKIIALKMVMYGKRKKTILVKKNNLTSHKW